MQPGIDLITIWTDDITPMKKFYAGVLGFKIQMDLGNYVEFESANVRFAICRREVMYEYSEEYRQKSTGQAFELAFACRDVADVDSSYRDILSKGGIPVQEPKNMEWEQRTALFSDPDGNIHEIFADLK